MSGDGPPRQGTANPTPEIGKSIRAAGVLTNYHEAGTGAPVVLLHGSGPGVSAWGGWRLAIPALAERLHVFAYDQVGFGQTELPEAAEYSLDLWVQHLIAFMEGVGLKRAHIVGNSMGAAVAIAAAVQCPDLVDRLVLMGAVGVSFALTEGLDATWGYEPSIANMKRLIGLFAYDRKLVTDELAELRYQASIRPGAQKSFSRMFPSPRQRSIDALARYETRLSDIRSPTLVIHGREDQVVPLANAYRLLSEIPNVQLHVFGHCGHWTQIEHATAFNRLVCDFLTEDA